MPVIRILALGILAAVFRARTPDAPSWRITSWWGILGLIGWGYLAGAAVLLSVRGRLWATVGCRRLHTSLFFYQHDERTAWAIAGSVTWSMAMLGLAALLFRWSIRLKL